MVPTLRQYGSATGAGSIPTAKLNVTLAATPIPGNVLVAVSSIRGGGNGHLTAIAGFTKLGPLYSAAAGDTLSVFYRTVQAGDPATVGIYTDQRESLWVGEISGTSGLDSYGTTQLQSSTATASASVTPTPGADYLLLSGSIFRGGDFTAESAPTTTPINGGTEVFDSSCGGFWPRANVNHRAIAAAAGAYVGGAHRDDNKAQFSAKAASIVLAFGPPPSGGFPGEPGGGVW